jgi:uncharacterized protein (TIGR02217 family)
MSGIETPRFPDCVAFGALVTSAFLNEKVVVASGFKQVNVIRSAPLLRFGFSRNGLTQIQHDELREFFNAVKGSGYQFRVKDHSDYSVTSDNGYLQPFELEAFVGASGVGYGTPKLIAQKVYTAGSLSTYRDLVKLLGTPIVYKNGSPLTVGVAAGNYAINVNNGQVTLVADQTRSINSHVTGSDHQIVLASAFSPNFSVGQRVYITACTGADAATLNDQSHELTGVSGSTLTLATDTTGLTISAGVASMFPQASDTMRIACEFDVWCRFTSDEASFEIIDKQHRTSLLYRWSGIDLEEEVLPLA